MFLTGCWPDSVGSGGSHGRSAAAPAYSTSGYPLRGRQPPTPTPTAGRTLAALQAGDAPDLMIQGDKAMEEIYHWNSSGMNIPFRGYDARGAGKHVRAGGGISDGAIQSALARSRASASAHAMCCGANHRPPRGARCCLPARAACPAMRAPARTTPPDHDGPHLHLRRRAGRHRQDRDPGSLPAPQPQDRQGLRLAGGDPVGLPVQDRSASLDKGVWGTLLVRTGPGPGHLYKQRRPPNPLPTYRQSVASPPTSLLPPAFSRPAPSLSGPPSCPSPTPSPAQVSRMSPRTARSSLSMSERGRGMQTASPSLLELCPWLVAAGDG